MTPDSKGIDVLKSMTVRELKWEFLSQSFCLRVSLNIQALGTNQPFSVHPSAVLQVKPPERKRVSLNENIALCQFDASLKKFV